MRSDSADAAVRELIPRALRFIADVLLARTKDESTYEWLMLGAGEIESLRDEVVRLKGLAPDLLPQRCPTCHGKGHDPNIYVERGPRPRCPECHGAGGTP
jgi:hypothetical protein